MVSDSVRFGSCFRAEATLHFVLRSESLMSFSPEETQGVLAAL